MFWSVFAEAVRRAEHRGKIRRTKGCRKGIEPRTPDKPRIDVMEPDHG